MKPNELKEKMQELKVIQKFKDEVYNSYSKDKSYANIFIPCHNYDINFEYYDGCVERITDEFYRCLGFRSSHSLLYNRHGRITDIHIKIYFNGTINYTTF